MSRMIQDLRAVLEAGVLSPVRIGRLASALARTGSNPFALLSVAASTFPDRRAIADERESLTYADLRSQCERLARALSTEHGVRAGMRVAIACRNHATAVKAIFALARLGTHVILINPDTRDDEATSLAGRLHLDFAVFDDDIAHAFESMASCGRAIAKREAAALAVAPAPDSGRRSRLARGAPGSVVVLSSGTTGARKIASRRPSVHAFLPPFVALLAQVRLARYRSVYIVTPLAHGFGLASLFIAVALGAEILLTERFDAPRANALVAAKAVDVVTVVPVMLLRMLAAGGGGPASVQCIISGGAPLDPGLARECLSRFGPILFNLYGTSEAGFCILATPEMILRNPESIGLPVPGVRARIVDDRGRECATGDIGHLGIRSSWTADGGLWVDTGDMARRDDAGNIYLAGRDRSN